MTTKDELEAAAQRVNALAKSPSTSDMLELYALYKQGTVGDVTTGRPGMLDVRGRAKWDAWNGKKGMTEDAARDAYVALAKRLGAG
jgi:acyl-CoA-binding protein